MGYLYCIGNPRTDWRYRTWAVPPERPQPDLPARQDAWRLPSINGMISTRGQARDYDQWAALTGEAAWAGSSARPTSWRTKGHHAAGPRHHGRCRPAAAQFHGGGGEWRVERQRCAGRCWTPSPRRRSRPDSRHRDFNRGDNFGVGYFEVNQRSGWRWNTTRRSRPCYGKPNLTVDKRAGRLIIEPAELSPAA